MAAAVAAVEAATNAAGVVSKAIRGESKPVPHGCVIYLMEFRSSSDRTTIINNCHFYLLL